MSAGRRTPAPHEAAASAPVAPDARDDGPRGRSTARLLLGSPTFVAGALLVGFWLLDAVAWHAFAPHDPLAPSADALVGPSGSHLLGTDDLGRDVFSRVLAGAAPVLVVGPAATLLGVLGGTVLGLVGAYRGGLVDAVLGRLVDASLAFPVIVIALLVLTVLGPSQVTVVLVIGLLFTPVVSRTVRAAAMVERDKDYVRAARVSGDGALRVMAVEILPNIAGPVLVETTVRLGYAIFTAATLSFLGVGLQIPSPDWGLTVAVERSFLTVNPWVVLGPALALASLVVGVNLLADGLRQVVEE